MPNEDYFASAATEQILKAPASVTADGNIAGIDATAFKGDCMAVLSLFKVAGTNPVMDVKIQTAVDEDVVITQTYSGTGNGTITELEGGPDSVAEDITVHMDSATGFTVTGSVSTAIGTGTVGTKFTSPQINFMITAGGTAFVHTDEFAIHTHERTYADVVAFTQNDGSPAGSIERKTFNTDQLGRFLRANMNIGGTASPEFIVGLALYGMQN